MFLMQIFLFLFSLHRKMSRMFFAAHTVMVLNHKSILLNEERVTIILASVKPFRLL